MIKLEWDEQSRTIKAGNFSMDGFCIYSDSKTLAKFILLSNNLDVKSYRKKDFNKEVCEKLGRSRVKFQKHLNGMMWKYFYFPVQDCLKTLPHNNGKISTWWIDRANKNIHIVKELQQDNLQHLAPICLWLKKTPAECKTYLGKGLWKKICKTPKTKLGLVIDRGRKYIEPVDDNISFHLNSMINLRYSFLRNFSNYINVSDTVSFHDWYVRKGGKVTNKRMIRTMFTSYLDTKRMATQLDTEFSLKWNFEQMERKHDEYSKAVNALRNPSLAKTYPSYDYYKELLKDVDTKGYELYHFKNGLEVQTEGVKQNHCIGYYAKSMYLKDILLFSIRKDDEIYSSVMFRKNNLGLWFCVQHYKAYNKEVDCPDAKQVVNNIQAKLNVVNALA